MEHDFEMNNIFENFRARGVRKIRIQPEVFEKNVCVDYTNEKLTRKKIVNEFLSDLKSKLDEEKNDSKSGNFFVIDRFEGDFAVCENRESLEMININKAELPNEVQEGDVLKLINNKYELDMVERQNIEERIKKKTENLFEECE